MQRHSVVERSPVSSLVLDPVRESVISFSDVLLREGASSQGWTGRCQRRWLRGARRGGARTGRNTARSGDRCHARWCWCSQPVGGVVRAEPDLFGSVASDPDCVRLITALAADIGASLPRLALRAPLRGRGDVRWRAGRAIGTMAR